MSRLRVIVVDDEPSVRTLATRVLEKAGYDVAVFESGEAALPAIEKGPVDVLIIDKSLPRMDGVDVLKKARETRPLLPAVLITASPEAYVATRTRIEVYVPKPFKSINVLEEAVRQALELARGAHERADLQKTKL